MYIRCSVRRGEEEGQDEGKKREREGRVVGIDSTDYFLRLTSRSIFDNRENRLPYFTYVVAGVSLFRLSECFCISIASLYFLGKYDVVVAIVVVLSNNI